MVIDNKHEMGETVYLTTDDEQRPRLVTKISLVPGGVIVYQCSCGTQVSEHYELELSSEPDLALKAKS